MYRPKPNKEQDYPKTQVTNQQIKAQAIPACYIFLCVFFGKFLLNMKQTKTYKHHKDMKLTKTNKQHTRQKPRLSEHEQPLKGM